MIWLVAALTLAQIVLTMYLWALLIALHMGGWDSFDET